MVRNRNTFWINGENFQDICTVLCVCGTQRHKTEHYNRPTTNQNKQIVYGLPPRGHHIEEELAND